MENASVICCGVDRWCEFVRRMSPAQRIKLQDGDVHCMLDIPTILIRKSIITKMLEGFNPKTKKIVLQPKEEGISATGVDVECIMGLKDKGLNIDTILLEEGEEEEGQLQQGMDF